MASHSEDYSQMDISTEEKDKLVAEVMRYVLFKTHQSSGCPIKREELTKLVTKNYGQRSLPTLIINEAQQKLSSMFGYEMKELQRSRPNKQSRASQSSAVETKSYILESQLRPDIYSKFVENKKTAHVNGFTFVVISIIHLAGGKMTHENLWHQLRRMGVEETDERHPVFGNTKQMLETLVSQRFLHKEKVNGPEGNTLTYELAERSLEESFSQKLKEYIGQIVNDDSTIGIE